jgi:hypothetical protein
MNETKPDERLKGINIDAPCICGNEATCAGNYEGAGIGLGCDACCGHGNEDGWCLYVDDERHARALVAAREEGRAEGYAQAREQAAGVAYVLCLHVRLRAMAEEMDKRIRAMQPETQP